MRIAERINEDLVKAQKSKDTLRLSALRMIKSELRYKEIDKRKTLSDEETVAVLSTMAKKHRDSIEQFKTGNRSELVAREEAELKVVQDYLPQQLSEGELSKLVDQSISEAGAKGKSDLGKVMKQIMPKVKGRVDGKLLNQLVTAELEKLESLDQN
ncbi:MAG: GatB/YqeY domain-containing protein [candidate division Zixibacteria bacterium]|nr:GatB/YqeY domain-containing protein [candidate division Zixibacteria bacterium]